MKKRKRKKKQVKKLGRIRWWNWKEFDKLCKLHYCHDNNWVRKMHQGPSIAYFGYSREAEKTLGRGAVWRKTFLGVFLSSI